MTAHFILPSRHYETFAALDRWHKLLPEVKDVHLRIAATRDDSVTRLTPTQVEYLSPRSEGLHHAAIPEGPNAPLVVARPARHELPIRAEGHRIDGCRVLT